MAAPEGVLFFRHPDHAEVFAVYPNGVTKHVQWALWNVWALTSDDVILLNKANGSADSDYAAFVAYDKALRG